MPLVSQYKLVNFMSAPNLTWEFPNRCVLSTVGHSEFRDEHILLVLEYAAGMSSFDAKFIACVMNGHDNRRTCCRIMEIAIYGLGEVLFFYRTCQLPHSEHLASRPWKDISTASHF